MPLNVTYCLEIETMQDFKTPENQTALIAPDLYRELKYAVECVEAGCMPNADWVERAKAAMAEEGE